MIEIKKEIIAIIYYCLNSKNGSFTAIDTAINWKTITLNRLKNLNLRTLMFCVDIYRESIYSINCC